MNQNNNLSLIVRAERFVSFPLTMLNRLRTQVCLVLRNTRNWFLYLESLYDRNVVSKVEAFYYFTISHPNTLYTLSYMEYVWNYMPRPVKSFYSWGLLRLVNKGFLCGPTFGSIYVVGSICSLGLYFPLPEVCCDFLLRNAVGYNSIQLITPVSCIVSPRVLGRARYYNLLSRSGLLVYDQFLLNDGRYSVWSVNNQVHVHPTPSLHEETVLMIKTFGLTFEPTISELRIHVRSNGGLQVTLYEDAIDQMRMSAFLGRLPQPDDIDQVARFHSIWDEYTSLRENCLYSAGVRHSRGTYSEMNRFLVHWAKVELCTIATSMSYASWPPQLRRLYQHVVADQGYESHDEDTESNNELEMIEVTEPQAVTWSPILERDLFPTTSRPQALFDANITLPPGLLDSVGDFNDNFSRLLSIVDNQTVRVDGASVWDYLVSSFIESEGPTVVKNVTLRVVGTTVMFTSFVHYFYTSDKKSLCLALVSYAGCLSLGVDCLGVTTYVLPRVMEMLSSDTQPQANVEDLDSIVSSLATIVGMTLVSKSNRKFETSFKFLSVFGTMKNNFVSILKAILSAVEAFVNYIREDYMEISPIRILQSSKPDIKKFFEYCDLVYGRNEGGQLWKNTDNYNLLSSTIALGRNIQTNLSRDQTYKDSAHMIMREMRTLDTIMEFFKQMNPAIEGVRIEPTVACFVGSPGNMKSTIVHYTVCALVASEVEEVDLEHARANIGDYFFVVNNSDNFCSGFNPRKMITLIDDIGQIKTVAGMTNNEWDTFMRMASNFPYNLNMPNLGDKGNTFYDGKYILMTSNMRDFKSDAILDQGALKRRIRYAWLCAPKDRYTRDDTKELGVWHRKLDMSKVERDSDGTTILDTELVEFWVWDLEATPSPKVTGDPPISFDQMVQVLLNHRKKSVKIQGVMKSCMTDVFDKYARPQALDFHVKPLQEFDDVKIVVSHPMSETISKMEKFLADGPPDEDEEIFDRMFENSFYLRRYYYAVRGVATGENDLQCLYDLYDILGEEVLSRFVHNDCRELMSYIKLRDQLYSNSSISTTNLLITRTGQSYEIVKKHFFDLLETIDNFMLGTPFGDTYKSVKNICSKYPHLVTVIPILLGGLAYAQSKPTVPEPIRVPADDIVDEVMRTLPQMGSACDRNGDSLCYRIAKRNLWLLSLQKSDQDNDMTTLGSVLMVVDRVGLMPYHYMKMICKRASDNPAVLSFFCEFRRGEQIKRFTIADLIRNHNSDLLRSDDLCLFQLGEKFQPCKSIVENFLTEKELVDLCEYNFKMYTPRADGINVYSGVAKIDNTEVISKDFGNYKIEKCFSYPADTVVGDCGSLFCLLNSAYSTSKIAGIHVAGSRGKGLGYSAHLSRGRLSKALERFKFNNMAEEDVDYDLSVPQCVPFIPSRFNLLYRLPSSISRGTLTKVMRSELESTWGEPVTAIARSKPYQLNGELQYPITDSLNKYCARDILIDETILSRCVNSLITFLATSVVRPNDFRLYTWMETMAGLPANNSFKGLKRSTSVGFPDILVQSPLKGKQRFFGCDVLPNYNSPECDALVQRCEDTVEMLKRRTRPLFVFVDFEKDERLALHKVAAHQIRFISGAPIAYVMIFRRYFGSFMTFMTDNKIVNGCATGVNVYSEDWNMLYRYLNTFPKGGAGDYSRYDASELPQVLWAVYRVITAFYGQSDKESNIIREMLWLEVVNSRHVLFDIIYEWDGSLPSGHPATTLINNLYNHLNFRLVWSLRGLPIDKFNSNVRVTFQGDDHVYTVSNTYVDEFTEQKVAEIMPLIGMTYTSEHKQAVAEGSRPVVDVEFLKRRFVYDNEVDLVVAPLRLATITEMVLWTKKGHSYATITKNNVTKALQELSLHGREVYDRYAQKMIDALYSAHHCYPPTLTYESCREAIFSRDSNEEW